MADDIAIKVESVSKSFRLPHDKQNSIKGGLISLVKGGKRTYETQEVLKDISFEIKKGEFFGIVGRNGSGKSTLLKMLAGIYTPTNGSIQVNGSLTPFIELGVGFNPELTGRENVFLNGSLLGFNRDEMAAMYDDIVEFAELERFMDQKLKNYSSGMQVRLAFSIAIRARGDILLLDEVLAVGDEAFQRKCDRFFDKIKKDKSKTVILVTHSMANVREYCDTAMMLRDGEIVAFGSPEDVANEYSMENLTGSTETVEQKRNSNSPIQNLKVNTKPKKRMSQNDTLEVHVAYNVLDDTHTRVKLSAHDIDRNMPLFASNSPVIEDKTVSVTLRIKLESINDTNMKISVSIRNAEYEILHFLPDSLAPIVSVTRTDYPDPTKKTSWSVLFSRGEWSEK